MRNRWAQISFILAGIFILTTFFLPLWKITLIAPQYPKGVQMHIHINKIDGRDPGTLQNINILNHYIGMKPIEPDSIPELTYFPYFVIGFSIVAFVAALVDRKMIYLIWVLLFIIALSLAMYDFYLWEYDYGHSLSPNAPMKFEEESFQPPLIGSKDVINFVARSYPHWGGYLVAMALVLSIFGTYVKCKK